MAAGISPMNIDKPAQIRIAVVTFILNKEWVVVGRFFPWVAFPITLKAFSDTKQFVVFDDCFITTLRTKFEFPFQSIFEFFIPFLFLFHLFNGAL